MDPIAIRELARIQSLLQVLKAQRDNLSELADISAFRGLEESFREDHDAALKRGLVPPDPVAAVREDWRRLSAWSNRIQRALRVADELGRQTDSTGSEPHPKAGKKKEAAVWAPTLSELQRLRKDLEGAPKALADVLEQGRGELRSGDWFAGRPYPELADIVDAMEWAEKLELSEAPGAWAQGLGIRDRPLVASRLAVESGSPMIERRQRRLKERLGRVVDLIQLHGQHAATVEEVGRLTDAGQVETARNRMTTVRVLFADIDYSANEQKLAKVEKQLEARGRKVAESTAGLQLLGREALGFFPVPPLGLRRRARVMVNEAEMLLAETSAESSRWPTGSELGSRLAGWTAGLKGEVEGFHVGPMRRLRRWILGTSLTWLFAVSASGLMFQLHQVRQEQERQRVAAETKAKAEVVWARLAGGDRFNAGEGADLGILVRWIPAGLFTMGSPGGEEDRGSDEGQHLVVLTQGFFLAETECTQAQWKAVMGNNPSNFKGADRPVERVSWDEAVDFCRKLTATQRAKGILPEGWEWRLPTEAEWEYAARAGTTGARHGELDNIAWHDGNSGNQTHPVTQKAANPWGLHDMLGNVWEWCSDWYGDYPTRSVTNPKGPVSGSGRVLRGGSWSRDAWVVRSANRDWFDPGNRHVYLGFRPALSSVR